MALNSSRLAIAQALVSLIAGITNPSTGQPLYQATKLGSLFDPSSLTSWCEVVHYQGKGGPAGSGGNQIGWRIDDHVTFSVTSGVGPYETDSTAAQVSMLTIQDILLPTIRQHFQLPQAGAPTLAVGSVYSVLVEQVDRSRVAKFPNGHVYILWDIFVTVMQQYSISLTQP
jgi:hypothetical protein